MDKLHPRLMIVAGEESGDMRAAALIRAIKSYAPHATFTGIGGERCRKEGVQLFADITQLAVIGFTEVLKHYGRIKRVFDLTLHQAKTTRPDAAILVDYPGFNLRLAKELKKLNIRVIYYISPQVWAWKSSRVNLIKKVVDRMIVLFPFEKEFYAKRGYAADFVGHPLVDEVRATKGCSQFLKEIGLDERKKIIGLLPGSREKEISRHLPVMLKAASQIKKAHPECQILLLKAGNIKKEFFDLYVKRSSCPVTVTEDYYNGLNTADICIVASGTATLETGLMGKPMVVVYKTSWPTWLIARLVIRIPQIALVNIVAEKKIAEELLQTNASPEKIAQAVSGVLKDPRKAEAMRRDLKALASRLGAPGASFRAAKIILDDLKTARRQED